MPADVRWLGIGDRDWSLRSAMRVHRQPWRLGTVVADTAALLGLVLSVPLAILAVGTPVALAILAMMWVVRQALGAF
jgi:hypothetical protein